MAFLWFPRFYEHRGEGVNSHHVSTSGTIPGMSDEAPPVSEPERPPRPLLVRALRGGGKLLLWSLSILFLLLCLTALAVKIFLPDEKLREALVSTMESNLGVQVRAERLTLDL